MTTYAASSRSGFEQDGLDEIDGESYEPLADLIAADRARSSDPIADVFGQPNVGMSERIASGLAGAALAGYALARKRDSVGATLALTGGYLIFRGITGRCPAYTALRTGTATKTDNPDATIQHGQGIKVEKTVTVMKSRQEVFDFWRNLENLPRFMRHLESVTITDDTNSHWTASAPLGKTVEWDAEIINEIPGELIAWRSAEGSDIANAGSVRFKTLPAGRGTRVSVKLEYNPPAGILGAIVAKLFGEEPNQQVRDDLRRFANLMEAGEVPSIEGQPQGNAAGQSKTVGPMRANA